MKSLHVPALHGEYRCGPLAIALTSEAEVVHGKIAETLLLYDLVWPLPARAVLVGATLGDPPDDHPQGSYLRCGRMLVDSVADGLIARTTGGAFARGRSTPSGDEWRVTVPQELIDAQKIEELEDIVSLILTTGWRLQGWTPIHAAAVARGDRCAILCAATGGGKTTLTAALVRRGWAVLGDDKLLLRTVAGRSEIAALLHTFNLHPRTREWFPEVGDLESLPRYSAWTEKRKVSVRSIWGHAPAYSAHPTTLVALERREDGGVSAGSLDLSERLSALLRQTVIPAQPSIARAIVADVSRLAASVHGIALSIGRDAYREEAALDRIEAALQPCN